MVLIACEYQHVITKTLERCYECESDTVFASSVSRGVPCDGTNTGSPGPTGVRSNVDLTLIAVCQAGAHIDANQYWYSLPVLVL